MDFSNYFLNLNSIEYQSIKNEHSEDSLTQKHVSEPCFSQENSVFYLRQLQLKSPYLERPINILEGLFYRELFNKIKKFSKSKNPNPFFNPKCPSNSDLKASSYFNSTITESLSYLNLGSLGNEEVCKNIPSNSIIRTVTSLDENAVDGINSNLSDENELMNGIIETRNDQQESDFHNFEKEKTIKKQDQHLFDDSETKTSFRIKRNQKNSFSEEIAEQTKSLGWEEQEENDVEAKDSLCFKKNKYGFEIIDFYEQGDEFEIIEDNNNIRTLRL